MVDTVVLAYSGGLDTSVSIPWIAETYDADVVALLIDIGQPTGNVADALARAETNGATDARSVDLNDAFASDYIGPAIQANARYEGVYPLATALARPLMAEALVGTAHDTGATHVAHGCTAKGNDQVRFDVSVKALDPEIGIVAPQREWRLPRDEAVAWARERGVEVPDYGGSSPYSIDENLWGRSIEGGPIEDPGEPVPADAWAWTEDPADAPDVPDRMTIAFEQGVPVSVDGKELPLADLVKLVNIRAGDAGVGRIDHVENRRVGFKSREAYEAPAAQVLLQAHQALESLTLTRDVTRFKPTVEQRFAQLVYDGLWFSPLREALQAFLASTQAVVSGEVEVELHKGSVRVLGRTAASDLYDHDLATYDGEDAFDHDAAEGFIELWGLPLRTAARRGPEDPA